MEYKGKRVFRGKLFEKILDAGKLKLISHGVILFSFVSDGMADINNEVVKSLLEEKGNKLYLYKKDIDISIPDNQVFVSNINVLFSHKYNGRRIRTYRQLKKIALKLNKEGYGINIPADEKGRVKKIKTKSLFA